MHRTDIETIRRTSPETVCMKSRNGDHACVVYEHPRWGRHVRAVPLPIVSAGYRGTLGS